MKNNVWSLLLKKRNKMVALCVTAGLFLSMAVPVFAADYSYTCTVSGGTHGTINRDEVKTSANGNYGTYVLSPSDVTDIDDGYYVKGFAVAGSDTSDPANLCSNYVVTEDLHLVVVYGVSGAQKTYTVRYEDATGKELRPASTYTANVDDKVVIGAIDIDGMLPQARNLAKTIVADDASNVITFVYAPIPVTGGTQNGATTVTTVTQTTGGINSNTAGGTSSANDATGDATTDNGTTAANDGDQSPEAVAEEHTQQPLTIEEVPDMVDLDDDNVPLANQTVDDGVLANSMVGNVVPISMSIIGGCLVVFIIGLTLSKRKARK